MRATSYLGDRHAAARTQGAGGARLSLPRRRRTRSAQPTRRDAVGSRSGFSGPRQFPSGLSRTHRGIRAARRRPDLGRPRDDPAQYVSRAGSTRSRCCRRDRRTSPRSDLASLCKGELLEELDGLSASFDQWLLERALALHRAAARAARSGAQAGAACKQGGERARRNCAPPDQVRSDARGRLAHPDARARRHGRARAGAARIRALPRGAEAVRSMSSRRRRRTRCTRRSACSGREDRSRNAEPLARAAAKRHKAPAPAPSRATGCASACCRFSPADAAGGERLAFSLSQEIASALARFRWFDVIAPDGADAPQRPPHRSTTIRCGRTSWTM